MEKNNRERERVFILENIEVIRWKKMTFFLAFRSDILYLILINNNFSRVCSIKLGTKIYLVKMFVWKYMKGSWFTSYF
jgi:hypothetical protein